MDLSFANGWIDALMSTMVLFAGACGDDAQPAAPDATPSPLDGDIPMDECTVNTDCDRANGEVCASGSCRGIEDLHPEASPEEITCDATVGEVGVGTAIGQIGNGLDVDAFTYTFATAHTLILSVEARAAQYPSEAADELDGIHVSYVLTEPSGGSETGSYPALVGADPTDDSILGEAGATLEVSLSGHDATTGGGVGYTIYFDCTGTDD